jgi:hypothetical protein
MPAFTVLAAALPGAGCTIVNGGAEEVLDLLIKMYSTNAPPPRSKIVLVSTLPTLFLDIYKIL